MRERFIKSTIVLIIGGLVTKLLGMVIRIITTRLIGLRGIGLYMLIMPTYGLFITIATLSLPVAISKLVAENKRNNKNVILGIIPIAMIINIFFMIIVIILAKPISSILLQNKSLCTPILAMSITLPFITLSNIIRGYFFGKERMIPHVTSNIIEQLIRIGLIIGITSKLLEYGLIITITGLIFLNIISELLSIIILIFFVPKKITITKQDILPDKNNLKDIFKISIPTTTGRIISSISTFIEPIIITYVLLKTGYTAEKITTEYGIISGYVFPLVMMPQFLSSAIANALLPTISKYHASNNYKQIKKALKKAIGLSLIIGIFSTTILTIFPKESLKLVFNTTKGTNYLLIAAPIFLLTYIESPILSTLQAINKADIILKSSLIGAIIKSIVLFFTLYLNIKMYALLISILIQYLLIIIYQYKKIKQILKKE